MSSADILIGACLLSACYYCWFILRAFAGLIQTPSPQQTDRRVEVVVAARNEEESLPRCLAALSQQDYPKDRVRFTIVDDGSDDGTADVVRSFAGKDDRFHLLQLERQKHHVPSRKRGRKPEALAHGIAASDAEIILTTDADCEPGPGWITALTSRIHDDVVYAFGPIVEKTASTLLGALRSLEILGLTGMAGGRIGIGKPMNSLGANLAFTRSIYERTGGFDYSEVKSDEETMMHRIVAEHLGTISFVASREARVLTQSPSSFGGFWNQRKRWGSMHGRFSNRGILLELLGVYVSLLIPIVSLLLAFWNPIVWPAILLFFFSKMAVDFAMLRRSDRLFGDGFSLTHFLLAELFHPFYILTISTVAQFLPYTWKQRTVLTVDPSSRNNTDSV